MVFIPATEAERIVDSAITTKVVLVVEYDGHNYYGFQLQAGLPTIQGELETALYKLTGESLRVLGASRTDTGVHARGQVVSFRTKSVHPTDTIVTAMNYYLPRDIAVKAAYRVDDGFDVRRRATSRDYEYKILNSRTRSPLNESSSYFVGEFLDIEAMNGACQMLEGDHDFASFASDLGVTLKSTVRTVMGASVTRDGDIVTFGIKANSFLPHQVRNTVGALLRVGWGRMSHAEFYSIMEAKKIGMAGPTAPALGLCLIRVNYPQPIEEEI